MRRLIVNADDFGLTAGVNRGIVQAHEHGIVTSTTLMANGDAFGDAVKLAKGSSLSVGCHIVLVDGNPLLPAWKVPSLTENGSQFYSSVGRFMRAVFTGRLRAEEVEAEATTQIRKLQAEGIAVSHVDTHKHTHLFPQILEPIIRAAKSCGVPAIRNPFEPLHFGQFWNRPQLWKRALQVKILHAYQGNFLRKSEKAGLQTTEGSVGVIATGFLDRTIFIGLMESLPEGTWELVCHPGYDDNDLGRIKTRLRQSRETELAILTAPETTGLLQKQGIRLLSCYDLGSPGNGT